MQQQFPQVAVEAVELAEPNELLIGHLARALTPGTDHYDAFGPDSTQHWDHIVFQEESQQVALGGRNASDSEEALEKLTELAVARGAQVAVVLTWAWLDGANQRFPFFADMQASLSCPHPFGLVWRSRKHNLAAALSFIKPRKSGAGRAQALSVCSDLTPVCLLSISAPKV
jgi:hypothetical protein